MANFKNCLVFAALALVTGSSAANANVIVSSVGFDAAPGPGEVMVEDFDHPIVAGFTLTYSGAQLHQAPLVSGIAAPPFGDDSVYLAVLTNGIATLKTPKLNSLSIYIGSLDTYNTIAFTGAGGFYQSFGGLALYPPADGNQFVASTNRRFTFDFDAADLVDQIDFTSSGNSFEFDNIAVEVQPALIRDNVGVPEPVTLSLFSAGLAGAAALRRRKRAQQA